MAKVVKFGGSSLADANQFRKVADIIRSDKERRYVVPSAPGKRFSDDTKVTDMLYKCYDDVCGGANAVAAFLPIADRYNGIISDLGLTISLDREYEEITDNFTKRVGRDYAASRGEYLNGIILANYLGFNFVDAAKGIFFKANGEFDAELTDATLASILEGYDCAVIPGFYGANPDGSIRTFSRGGSDFTGSVVAKAIGAELYENWTDVPGFAIADPRIVKNPKFIDVITYRELRELSYMGATVGIAGKKNFSAVAIEKDEMNGEIGFLRRILTLMDVEKINFEHIPTGIDTMTLIVDTDDLKKHPNFAERVKEVSNPNHIEIEDHLALIAVVGRGMKATKGTATRIFAALSHANINIKMIDQGSSELNIIIGIHEDDFDEAIRVIYNMFMLQE